MNGTNGLREQEMEFLAFCGALLDGGSPRSGGDASSFAGLGANGQKELADMLCGKAVSFLIETGATISGTAYVDSVRTDDFSLLTSPVKLHFSEAIYRILTALYRKEQPEPASGLTCGDELLLTILMKNIAYTANFPLLCRYALRHSFLAPLSAIPDMGSLRSTAAQESGGFAFLRDRTGFDLIYFLRFFLRDALADLFRSGLSEKTYDDLVLFGRYLGPRMENIYLEAEKLGRYDVLEPFCELYEIVMSGPGWIDMLTETVEKAFRDAAVSRKTEARRRLVPLFGCFFTLDEIIRRAANIRPYDEAFAAVNVLKKNMGVISTRAKENTKALLHFMKNIVE